MEESREILGALQKDRTGVSGRVVVRGVWFAG
jgi:hypothetical protein